MPAQLQLDLQMKNLFGKKTTLPACFFDKKAPAMTGAKKDFCY